MLFDGIIRNDAGFGRHNFTSMDYVGKYPSVFIYGREYTEDIRSIVLVSDWGTWTPSELDMLNDYGRQFTFINDRNYHIRLGTNYMHIGKYHNDGEYMVNCSDVYVVKRHSWNEAQYFDRFEDLTRYLDELMVYGT